MAVAGNAADTYERAPVPAIFAAWAPLVVDVADLRPGARVVDVARVSDEARLAIIGEVAEGLTPYVAGDALTFPIEAHLASAKK